MAEKKNPGDPKQPLQEESIVARLKSASGGGSGGLTTYTGLLGRSPKEGYWLLYPTLDMSTCIEIQESDIVHSETLPPEQSPFSGLGGTRVFVRKGAQVTTTRTVSRTSQAGADDEFDLDLRVGQSASGRPDRRVFATGTDDPNCTDHCPTGTCNTVCDTCVFTRCDQGTCRATCTCPTQCDQGTCRATCTCPTQCNQGTCRVTCTCRTQCKEDTCNTCDTQCFQNTCRTVCFGTCQETCKCTQGIRCVFTDVCQ